MKLSCRILNCFDEIDKKIDAAYNNNKQSFETLEQQSVTKFYSIRRISTIKLETIQMYYAILRKCFEYINGYKIPTIVYFVFSYDYLSFMYENVG